MKIIKARSERGVSPLLLRCEGQSLLIVSPTFGVLIFHVAIFTSIVERERSGSYVSGERTPLLSTTPLFATPRVKDGIDPKGSQYGSVISEQAI